MDMIETAVEQDSPHILRLTANAGVFKPIEEACVQGLWNAYIQQGESSGYVFLIHRHGETAQGYACFGPHPLTEGIFDLYWIAVAPEARGQGLGHTLLARVEDEVRARGGRMILVETSGTLAYTSARRLYESCGYRYEAVIHDFYSPGDDLILFSKLTIPIPAELLIIS